MTRAPKQPEVKAEAGILCLKVNKNLLNSTYQHVCMQILSQRPATTETVQVYSGAILLRDVAHVHLSVLLASNCRVSLMICSHGGVFVLFCDLFQDS